MSNQPPPPGDNTPPGGQPPSEWYPPQGGQPGQPGQQGPPPGYYQQGPPGYQQQPAKGGSGMAVTALVLGIVALLFSWTIIGGILLGLAAVVLGFIASGRAKRGRGAGRGMAITGIVLGVLSLAVAIAIIVGAVSFLNSDTGQDLQNCIDDAGNDQAAVEQCERDFEEDLTDRLTN